MTTTERVRANSRVNARARPYSGDSEDSEDSEVTTYPPSYPTGISGVEDQKKEEEKKNKEILIEEIRRIVLKDPNVPLNARDILPPEVSKLTIEQLKMVIFNAQLHESKKNTSTLSPVVVSTLSEVVAKASGSKLTLLGISEDESLAYDIDCLISDYLGYIPAIGRILLKCASHITKSNDSKGQIEPHSTSVVGNTPLVNNVNNEPK